MNKKRIIYPKNKQDRYSMPVKNKNEIKAQTDQIGINELENFLLKYYKMRRNLVTGQVECYNMSKPEDGIKDFNKTFANSIVRAGEKIGVKLKRKEIEDADPVEIIIINDYLIPEFNTIKYYFAKKINGKKYFIAKCEAVFINNILSKISSTSEDISLINEMLLEAIRKERIIGASGEQRNKNVNSKSMDAEELNKELGGDPLGLLKLNGAAILKVVREEGKIRNREQLK